MVFAQTTGLSIGYVGTEGRHLYISVDSINIGSRGGSWGGLYPGFAVSSPGPYTGAETQQEWYNPLCFSEPANGFFGNSLRNTIKGPGFAQFDISVTKDTKISESTMIELRAETFNFVNHPNLGFPTYQSFTKASGARNAVAGQIQDTAGYTSRQIQIAAKFTF